MNSFCAGCNLKSLIRSGRCPNIIQKCQPILQNVYAEDRRGTLMTDLRTLDKNINDTYEDSPERWPDDRQDLCDLEPSVYDALKIFCLRENTNFTASRKGFLHTHYTIRGFKYTTSVSNRKDSIIFFQSEQGDSFMPAAIRQIFSIPAETCDGTTKQAVFMAVEPFEAATDSNGPFHRWKDFGAGLWRGPAGPIQIIRPSANICHANQRKWDEDCWVMRPLNRVSQVQVVVATVLNFILVGLLARRRLINL